MWERRSQWMEEDVYAKLKLLFNVPLAFALAFLIVGAPSAPLYLSRTEVSSA